jgi:hypothetical protein
MTESYVRLLDSVEDYHAEDGLLLVQGMRSLRIRGGGQRVRTMVRQLRSGTPGHRLLDQHGPVAARLITELGDMRWLTSERPVAIDEDVHWSRQVGYLGVFAPDTQAQQRSLCDARVAILGVGGIGGSVAQQLAGAGVGALWLVDHDEVAAHNLNRQYLFGRADVGHPKAMAAAAALGRLAPELSARPLRRRITARADLDALPADLDLMIVAADEPADLMDAVWAWAEPHGVPVIRAAVGLETGWWGPLVSVRHGSCWRHFEADRRARLTAEERRLEASAAAPLRWSFGPSNAAIAAMLGHDALQFLAVGTCATLGRRAVLNLSRMTIAVTGDAACESLPDGRCTLRSGGQAG